MHEIDARDRELMTALQAGLPLISTPWAGIGQIVDMSEKEVIRRVERLRRGGGIRSISGNFEGRALGYQSCLVAAQVNEADLELVASRVNLHPGVTSSYQRNHRVNLWFSLTVPGDSVLGLEATARRLADGCETLHVLPAIRSFHGHEPDPEPERVELTAERREVIDLLQRELPNVPRPFDYLAKGSGLSSDTLQDHARELHRLGALRRIGAVLQPRGRAFGANAIVAWELDAGRAEDVAAALAARREIGRSWIRPTVQGWEYPLYSPIHGRTVEECQQLAADLASEFDIDRFVLLFPVREFKRSRVVYLNDGISRWERPDSPGAVAG